MVAELHSALHRPFSGIGVNSASRSGRPYAAPENECGSPANPVWIAGLATHACLVPPYAKTLTTLVALDAVERDLDAAGFDTAHVIGNALGG
jgi:hypothetical protein